MKPKLMGIKQGMMQIFDKLGNTISCSVILAEKHVISQIKTKSRDGYEALQLASLKSSKVNAGNVKKPQLGFFKKVGIEPRRRLFEVRVDCIDGYEIAQEMGVALFENVHYVDVMGTSKGKGHQGVMKRHNFAGGPAAHGSGFHRHGGSCGMRSTPGRCLPGQKKSGRMGFERVTVENLPIIRVDVDRGLILVGGAIPGYCGSVVYIAQSEKKGAVKSGSAKEKSGKKK
jgi:large subunit ribosomal protein L3